jgi:hypothetical protein
LPWSKEIDRFFRILTELDEHMANDKLLGVSPEGLFQGPIADALTHVGQLAYLRRLAGIPVKGENYFVAKIAVGRVGAEQAAAVREF